MGKYTVTYADGVKGEVELFGPIAERERRIAWLSSRLSPEGYRKQQDELKSKGEIKSNMRTIIRYIPGQDPKTLIPALETDLAKSKDTYARLNKEFEELIKPNWTESEINAWKTGRLSYGYHNSSVLLSNINKAKNEATQIEANIDKVKKQGVVNPIVEFVAINSFDQKDKLREAGYRFSKDGYWSDPFGMKVTAAWIKRIEVKSRDDAEAQAKLVTELNRVKSMGSVEGDNLLNQITASAREGIVTSPNNDKPESNPPTTLVKPEPKPSEPVIKVEPVKPEPLQLHASPEPLKLEAPNINKIESQRTKLSQSQDASKKHSVIIEQDDPKIKQWVRDPGSMDVLGVDTPKGVTKPTVDLVSKLKEVKNAPKTPHGSSKSPTPRAPLSTVWGKPKSIKGVGMTRRKRTGKLKH